MTSESKHTAGPWHVVPYGDGDSLVICSDEAGDWRIAFMATMIGPEEIDGPIRANARLIAAAPELLEALEAFAKHFGPLHDNEWLNDECRHCFKLARNALSRVRGET